MTEPDETESNCKDLSCGDDEWWEMLFELLDHSIDEYLPSCVQHTHKDDVKEETMMLHQEDVDIEDLAYSDGVEE